MSVSVQALEQEMVSLMREVDAERAGSGERVTGDDDARVARVGEIMMLIECFYPEAYDAIVERHFVR